MIWVSSDKNGTKLKHSIILFLPPYRNWNTLKGGHFWRISCDIVRCQHFLFFERYSQLNLSPKKTEKRHFFSRLVWLLSVGQAGLELSSETKRHLVGMGRRNHEQNQDHRTYLDTPVGSDFVRNFLPWVSEDEIMMKLFATLFLTKN